MNVVNYEIAKKLKNLGFEESTYHYYNIDDIRYCRDDYPSDHNGDPLREFEISAPTISQVLKWLREEKKLHIEFVGNACGYLYIVSDIPSEGGTDRYCSDYSGPNDGGTWDKYEDCALNAIQYVLDNLI